MRVWLLMFIIFVLAKADVSMGMTCIDVFLAGGAQAGKPGVLLGVNGSAAHSLQGLSREVARNWPQYLEALPPKKIRTVHDLLRRDSVVCT